MLRGHAYVPGALTVPARTVAWWGTGLLIQVVASESGVVLMVRKRWMGIAHTGHIIHSDTVGGNGHWAAPIKRAYGSWEGVNVHPKGAFMARQYIYGGGEGDMLFTHCRLDQLKGISLGNLPYTCAHALLMRRLTRKQLLVQHGWEGIRENKACEAWMVSKNWVIVVQRAREGKMWSGRLSSQVSDLKKDAQNVRRWYDVSITVLVEEVVLLHLEVPRKFKAKLVRALPSPVAQKLSVKSIPAEEGGDEVFVRKWEL
ncbi:hypothetical protein OG21DRAFT_1528019 [Imleria badia]|nr:hypothetical protein OG21DRAFT_1528019 [Imleria badia]